jgi:outer membrane biosynthesis protein TonB
VTARRNALAAVVAAAVLVTAGCSASTTDGTPVTSAQAMLRADVLALSQHAAAGDRAAARAELDALTQDVAAAAAAGQITPALAQQLRQDIAAVSVDLQPPTTSPVAHRSSATPTHTPTHTPTTKPAPKPQPKPAPKPPGHGKHGHGHGPNKDG